jgi:selenocysteine lyase/cysteine desulfurase
VGRGRPRHLRAPGEQYDDLLTERTRFVALTGASNATGTRPDVAAVAERAHAVGALVHVDGVHATPHGPVDARALGADFWATSAYKWYGPHLGATAADPAVLEGLRPDKLLPSSDEVPDRFELGTLAFGQLAGLTAAVDWLAGWGSGATRRECVLSGVEALHRHEQAVFDRLLAGLRERADVTLVGRPARRTPTVAFIVAGRSPQQVAADLGAQGVCVWAGNYYAVELMTALGLEERGGAVRAGVACYTTEEDVDRLLAAL